MVCAQLLPARLGLFVGSGRLEKQASAEKGKWQSGGGENAQVPGCASARALPAFVRSLKCLGADTGGVTAPPAWGGQACAARAVGSRGRAARRNGPGAERRAPQANFCGVGRAGGGRRALLQGAACTRTAQARTVAIHRAHRGRALAEDLEQGWMISGTTDAEEIAHGMLITLNGDRKVITGQDLLLFSAPSGAPIYLTPVGDRPDGGVTVAFSPQPWLALHGWLEPAEDGRWRFQMEPHHIELLRRWPRS